MHRILLALMMVILGASVTPMTGCFCCHHHWRPAAAPASVSKAVDEAKRPTSPDMVVAEEVPPVYFDFDKSDIRADQIPRLEKTTDLLKAAPTVEIRIEGNCDERGAIEYNMSLGQRRAEVIKAYLVGHGIAAKRIDALSRGKENPVDPGHNEQAWAKNRRDEFFYRSKK